MIHASFPRERKRIGKTCPTREFNFSTPGISHSRPTSWRLHPQTLLCYEMYDQPLTREHGAPLRLNIPTKIGYKQAKYLTDLKVTNILDRAGYWEDQGYSKFYGL
jgi:DMSO/TMAO reductase YedYZ molybdopterin-dependent catalytic subunit